MKVNDPAVLDVLRISGRASVQTDPKAQRSYNLRVARKYVLTPGGIRHYLAHLRQLKLQHTYHAQAAEKGQPCVIEVTPLEAEFLDDEFFFHTSRFRGQPNLYRSS